MGRSVGPGIALVSALALTGALAGCTSVSHSLVGGGGLGDYNGDGAGDLAIGVPFKDIGDAEDAGAVALLFGDPASGRPGAGTARLLARLPASEEPGPDDLKEVARRSDRFGTSLATGDFNSDGFADLAIGVPYQDLDGRRDAGAVTVVYGDAAHGLDAGDAETWHQDTGGIPGDSEENDLFGSALAVADFNADGIDDLAIGAPFDNDGTIANGGAVSIIFGSLSGLADQRSQIWTQRKLGIKVQRANALFGSALATGDFDGNGVADLAVGTPDETWERAEQAGAVSVIYGTSSGLTADDNGIWRQSDRYIMGGDLSNTGDRFGTALAVGDFNGDGLDDLAVGTPEDDWGEKRDSGTVNILYGAPDLGITADNDEIWHQNRRGTSLTNDDRNNFGAALAGGDFNGDGIDDLAVGIPGQKRDGADRAGAVFVAYGDPEGGIVPQGSQVWQEGLDGLPGNGTAGDEFGAALAALDVDGDGYADLVVGAQGHSAGGAEHAGGALVIFGGPNGLSADGNQAWTADNAGLGGAESQSLFGAAVTGAAGSARRAPDEMMKSEEMMEGEGEMMEPEEPAATE